jgi:transcriptional regulator with XRE-family HTH domain
MRRELTVRALSRRCGLSSEYIESIENGTARDVGLDVIVALAKALGVEAADLLKRGTGH